MGRVGVIYLRTPTSWIRATVDGVDRIIAMAPADGEVTSVADFEIPNLTKHPVCVLVAYMQDRYAIELLGGACGGPFGVTLEVGQRLIYRNGYGFSVEWQPGVVRWTVKP